MTSTPPLPPSLLAPLPPLPLHPFPSPPTPFSSPPSPPLLTFLQYRGNTGGEMHLDEKNESKASLAIQVGCVRHWPGRLSE